MLLGTLDSVVQAGRRLRWDNFVSQSLSCSLGGKLFTMKVAVNLNECGLIVCVQNALTSEGALDHQSMSSVEPAVLALEKLLRDPDDLPWRSKNQLGVHIVGAVTTRSC